MTSWLVGLPLTLMLALKTVRSGRRLGLPRSFCFRLRLRLDARSGEPANMPARPEVRSACNALVLCGVDFGLRLVPAVLDISSSLELVSRTTRTGLAKFGAHRL